MKDFNVSSPQLLLNQAPISVLLLGSVVWWFDRWPRERVAGETLWVLGVSGGVAAVLNLSQFLVIGRMSALTFNVASK